MPAESKSLSEFPRALEVLSGALLLISNPSGQDSFDTNSALLTEVAQAMLDVHYTQELGDVSVFDAIKNCRVLSGTTTPTSALGVDGQLYIKYETTGGVDEVVAMYFKKSSAWLEISLGGGNTDYIECTQAQYDAWEQGGTLDPDTLYFITDGNIGNDIIDDSTASETTVYSSDKVEDLLSDKADASTTYTKAETDNAIEGIVFNSNPATGDYHFDLAPGWSVTNFVFNRVKNRIYMQGVFVKTSAFTSYEAFISLSSSSTKNINPYYETWFATMCDDGNGGSVSCERLQAVFGSLRIASSNSNHRRIFVCASWISVSDEV